MFVARVRSLHGGSGPKLHGDRTRATWGSHRATWGSHHLHMGIALPPHRDRTTSTWGSHYIHMGIALPPHGDRTTSIWGSHYLHGGIALPPWRDRTRAAWGSHRATWGSHYLHGGIAPELRGDRTPATWGSQITAFLFARLVLQTGRCGATHAHTSTDKCASPKRSPRAVTWSRPCPSPVKLTTLRVPDPRLRVWKIELLASKRPRPQPAR
jgi:hypothetical protein